MANEEKPKTEAVENLPEEKPSDDQQQDPSKKKKRNKKLYTIVGVVAAVVIVAGVGFAVWHEQPSFCNAICHTPMDAYLPTYESQENEPGIDKWGNEVSNSNAMLAPLHRAQENTTCVNCHVPTLGEQISEGLSWVTGDYEVYTTKTGMQVPAECDLNQLTAARGIESDQFCLNESCHNMTREDLIEATSNYERNPHLSQHSTLECSDCHKAHRASVNYCSSCHSDAPIPDGWLTVDESNALVKALQG